MGKSLEEQRFCLGKRRCWGESDNTIFKYNRGSYKEVTDEFIIKSTEDRTSSNGNKGDFN